MKSSKWNVINAAKYGAVLGIPIVIVDKLITGASFSGNAFYLGGEAIGAVVVGAFLFVVVAAIANLFIR